MNHTIITREEAKAQGMHPLTMPEPSDSPFVANVIRDMERVPGTIWAPVDAGAGRVEIWRVPVKPITSEDE
jgi:hypothetical protein